MNNIRLIIFSSQLHDGVSVLNSRAQLFEGIRSKVQMELVYPSTASAFGSATGSYYDGGRTGTESPAQDNESRTVCFIATGGTEEMFKQTVKSLRQPVYLLSDGLHNSFAASMEIGTYLESQGINHRIFNAPLDCDPFFFNNFIDDLFGEDSLEDDITARDRRADYTRNVIHSFSKSNIGLIGGASSWLIASDVDRKYISATYGAKFVDIPVSELEEEYESADPTGSGTAVIIARMEQFLTGGRTKEDLTSAARFYAAMKRICTRYSLTALTIRCFDILESCRTTACLSLGLLNDEGIVSGCEGDIPALWSMMYARAAYGRPSFMANPSSSNASELTIDFAHCTIPFSMVHGYRLPSHFESSIGIGIAGSVPSGRYRIVKIYGRQLDNLYTVEGDVIMNTNVPQRCRTQVRFKFDSAADFNRFMTTSKGNHIVLVKVN